jgi:hypothetical protein
VKVIVLPAITSFLLTAMRYNLDPSIVMNRHTFRVKF